MQTILWLGGLVLVVAGATLWLRSALKAEWVRSTERMSFDLMDKISKSQMNSSSDLGDRVGRSVGELREAFLEKVSKNFTEAQRGLYEALATGRREQHETLEKTIKTLDDRFRSLDKQVQEKLEVIGKSVETKLNENLKEGFQHFERVQKHLKDAELRLASLTTVGQSISDLNNLLKLPHLRGSFGEATLEKLLADFLPTGSYELQAVVVPGSTERVDAIVKLARSVLPIDSKFPRDQVMPLFETEDPAALETARRALSEYIRGQARQVAEKYIRPDHGTTDMALLFLPSETLYLEVVRHWKLFDEMCRLKVYPASPNTLAMGLRSVTMAQEYYDLARGVESTVEDVKKARRHFEHFERKFEDLGKGLRKAQEAFETANTHLNRYGSSVQRLVGDEDVAEPALLSSPAPEGAAAQLPAS